MREGGGVGPVVRVAMSRVITVADQPPTLNEGGVSLLLEK